MKWGITEQGLDGMDGVLFQMGDQAQLPASNCEQCWSQKKIIGGANFNQKMNQKDIVFTMYRIHIL